MTAVATHSAELAAFAEIVGLKLDDQSRVLTEICSVDQDGKWLNDNYTVTVGGEILDARALAGLFLFGERTILWVCSSAAELKASFKRVARLVQSSPELSQDVARICHTNGGQSIELRNGSRLLFASSLGARGCSADTLLIDGLLTSQDEMNVYPVLACAANPQRVQRV